MKKIVTGVIAISIFLFSIIGVEAKEGSNINLFSSEAIENYCDLINGCSYAALKNFDDDEYIEAVVYSGLDISDPKVLFNLGMFYVSNGVHFSKLTSDAVYSTNLAEKLDNYLYEKGVENTKAKNFYSSYNTDIKNNLKLKFDTLGAYTFKAKKSVVEKMLEDKNTDFVIVGSVFMLKKGDLNSDGDIDTTDISILNNVISKKYSYSNLLEEKFIRYASDYNEDKYPDINDVTKLQITLSQ